MKRFYFGRVFGNGDAAAGTGTNPPPPPSGETKTFTQDQVNAMLAEHKRGMQEKLANATAELEKFKKEGGNVQGLQERIKELNDSLLSKEQLAQQEAERIKNEYAAQLEAVNGKAKTFEQLHHSLLLSNEIGKAAVKHKAYDAEQLQVFVGNQAKVVEEKDNQGKGTGKWKVMVPWTVDGKVIELSADEAVAKMREDKRFGNLFVTTAASGAGMTLNNAPTVPSSDGKLPMDTNAYMAQRAANKAAGVL